MHHLISIEDLAKLTDAELVCVEARLRHLAFAPDLDDADLRRVLLSLSNAVYVRSLRVQPPRP